MKRFTERVIDEHGTFLLGLCKTCPILDDRGCNRGGGDWSIVKAILENIEKLFNVVFVAYKLQ